MESRIEKLECWVLRAPIKEPVANAFGTMTNRPALFLRIAASDGAWGWGEVFSNFPQVGAEHRARLIDSIFAPLLDGCSANGPEPAADLLARRTRQMAIQCGEPGPFAQIAGAVDQALWDITARRANLPLWQHLGIAYCPHWLAGGVGLAASMHALAGSGSEGGYAEVDANPNPLREEVFPVAIDDGWVTLTSVPGLGVEPDLRALSRFVVAH